MIAWLRRWPEWESWQRWILAIEAAVSVWTLPFARYQPHDCRQHPKACESLKDPLSFLYYPLGSYLDWIDRHHDVVIALGGLAVALFTFTLWRSTHRLWEAGEKQFIASHRPRVIVRSIRVPVLWDYTDKTDAGEKIEWRWLYATLANVGESEATVTEFIADYGIPPDPRDWNTPKRGASGTAKVIPSAPLTLQAGEQRTFEVISTTLRSGTSRIGDERAFVTGLIRYADLNGLTRTTKFTRMLDIGFSFATPSDDPAEEYAD